MLFRALALSLAAHCLIFGTYKWGQLQGWWRPRPIPEWLRFMQRHIPKPTMSIPLLLPKPKAATPPKEELMSFVDVDPALATPEPPKVKKYYGAANTQAASPVIKQAELPQLKGQQTAMIKTTDPGEAKMVQPAPKPQPKPEERPQPSEPKPAQQAEPQPKSPPIQKPGDLAFAKPQEALPENAQANPEPSSRPRTVEEALKKHGIQSQKMSFDGGANRLSMDSSLDVSRTATGDYDAELVDAVQQRWNKLLENRNNLASGKVVVSFKLKADGRIMDAKVETSEVSDIPALLCRKAIEDPAPYRKWPLEMRRELVSDTREMRFTFYYLNP